MTYRQAFDRLGNPIARPARAPLVHRIIQVAGLIATLVGLLALYGARAS